MKSTIALLAALLLSACASFDTPEEKYFATITFVKATGDIAEAYVDACKAQPITASCREKFPAINTGAQSLKTAMAETDRVFVTKDSAFYDLSLTATQNTANALRNVIKE